MAVKNTKSAKTASKAKMEVVNRIRTFFLESVNFGENTNGKKFLKGVLEGAIYGKSIDDVQPGIYTVVVLSTDYKRSTMVTPSGVTIFFKNRLQLINAKAFLSFNLRLITI